MEGVEEGRGWDREAGVWDWLGRISGRGDARGWERVGGELGWGEWGFSEGGR